MLDIITKEEYFSWLDQGYGAPKSITLKGIQDAFILSQLAGLENKKIAEIGGGQSRVLTILSEKNECWNVDKMEGVGQGPKKYKKISGVKLVKAYMGEYSSDLPEEYFDIVFSISVVDQVNTANLPDFFKDIARILKPGGLCIHAIDAYLGNSGYKKENPQIDTYRTVCKENGIPLEFIDEPKIDATSVFSCWYASNSDMCIYNWNKSVPEIVNVRNNCQSVSIKAVWKKSDKPSTFNIIKKPDFHQLINLPKQDQDLFKDKNPVYIFHHIPKCGGTAVVRVLEHWFTVKRDYISIEQLRGYKPVGTPIKLSSLSSRHCICSHFECQYNYLHVRYPEVLLKENESKYKAFTFIRDPLELKISLYYYEIKAGRRKGEEQTLENFLLSDQNYLAQRFPCNISDYRNILDRYFFIGLQEEMQTSIDRLAKLLNKKSINVPLVNVSEKDEQTLNLDEDLICKFKEKNRLSCLIYEYVQEKFFR